MSSLAGKMGRIFLQAFLGNRSLVFTEEAGLVTASTMKSQMLCCRYNCRSLLKALHRRNNAGANPRYDMARFGADMASQSP